MQKIRYETDPYNRLILDGTGGKSDLPGFRKILDGQFKLDGNNDLSYHIKAPLSEGENIPHQIRLKGEWSLTDTHDLRLTLDKSGRDTFGDEITLKGDILDADGSALLFAITTITKDNTRSTYVLNLSGSWKADENNRLSFHIRKEMGKYDILTFNGVWQINKNHQVIYQYEKAALIRKKKQTNTLTFKGYWQIKDALRISYVLSKGTDSAFDFEARTAIFKEGYIKYEIGLSLADREENPVETIMLYGRWGLKKDVGLFFEIEYENKKTHRIVFGADATLTGKDTITFRLKDDIKNKDIGIDIKLSRKMLKGDGETFLRMLASKRESAIYAGAAWRW